MRIVIHSQPAFFDTELPFVRELSNLAEVHLLVEVPVGAWRSGLFDVGDPGLPSGLFNADPILAARFPASVRAYWQNLASFKLLIRNARLLRLAHPDNVRATIQAALFVRRLRPDVFQMEDVLLRYVWPLPLLLVQGIPLVLKVHDPEPHSGERDWRKEAGGAVLRRVATRFVLHNAFYREWFERRYHVRSERIDVVPLGGLDIFRAWLAVDEPRPSSGGPVVLLFGRLSAYKGLDTLYAAAPTVAEQVPGVRFVIAGQAVRGYKPPNPPKLPHDGQVQEIHNYISNTQLAELFAAADVLVCPYTDASQSGVALTAYGFGKPVIASSVGGLPEYVRDGKSGLVIPPNDPGALAAAIVSVLRNPSLRRHLEVGVKDVMRERSWSASARSMVEVYRRAGGRKAR